MTGRPARRAGRPATGARCGCHTPLGHWSSPRRRTGTGPSRQETAITHTPGTAVSPPAPDRTVTAPAPSTHTHTADPVQRFVATQQHLADLNSRLVITNAALHIFGWPDLATFINPYDDPTGGQPVTIEFV